MKNWTAWTTTELAVIRKHYPRGGTRACAEHLPHRNRNMLRRKAHEMQLHADKRNVQLLARGLEDESNG